jgi:2-polyprenyl-3-methyl-5-hydroxy-6-metoxy-1,4-benzoquinol methylase/glycosyltransferase involved in cell wall biosynthesis
LGGEVIHSNVSARETDRSLVLIVAYEARSHIAGVLDRFPAFIWNNPAWEVLCIDDASTDDTARVAAAWGQANKARNLRVLRNLVNQGYGGNQKLGYHYAIDRGFDRVILIHGDGQYAPERVTGIAEKMRSTGADVFLGARTWSYWNARSGGMPRYKFIGNKILTWVQNRLTGRNLIEYHTGLRGYSIHFLRQLAFDLNSNDFHFDTEILLQAFYNNASITEEPIEAHYGDEVCRVNGLAYAMQVFAATLHYSLIRTGFLNSPQYRRTAATRYMDKTASPWSSHGMAIAALSRFNPATVLDIGCGTGHVAARLVESGIRVHGMDRADYSEGTRWSGFTRIDLDRDPFKTDVSSFDALICLDVIEHLKRPEELLIQIRESQRTTKAPVLILSTPNVAFLSVRLALLLGFFNYSDKGILDIDHSRLFTRESLLRLVRNAGYDVLDVVPVPAPWDFVVPGPAGKLLVRAHALMARVWPSLFAFQTLVACRPRQNLAVLLASAQQVSPGESKLTGEIMEQSVS